MPQEDVGPHVLSHCRNLLLAFSIKIQIFLDVYVISNFGFCSECFEC
jgi:hypothetical protein